MFSPARAALAAAALISLVIFPETAALRAASPGALAPAGSLSPSTARVGPLADAAFGREMAGMRLKELGLEPDDAWRIVDRALGVVDRADASALLDELAADAAELSGGQGSLAAMRDALARLQAVAGPRPLSNVMTVDLVARVFGYDVPEPVTDGGALGLMAAAGTEELAPVAAPHDPVPHVGGTCLTCPSFDYGVFSPTPTWQSHASSLCCTSNDCAWYAFSVQNGATYEFTTCSPEGGATFDTVLDLFSAGCTLLDSEDDTCGVQSRLQWTATFTGEIRLKVRGFGGATGDYTLAYRRLCVGDPDCAAPDAVLAPITTTCQLQSGNVSDCTGAAFYQVDLPQLLEATFTLCGSTCAGADAGFDSALDLYRGATLVATSTTSCGDDAEIVYTTPAGGGGTYCVVVRREAGASSGFTLGYRSACQAPFAVQILPDSASTAEQDCTRNQRFTVTSGGTPNFDYTWTVTPAPGNSATPPTGTGVGTSNVFTFDCLLQGDGAYQVAITVTNECGSASDEITFTLEDRAGPVLTPSADRVRCPTTIAAAPMSAPAPAPVPAPSSEPARLTEGLQTLSNADMRMLLSTPDPAVVRDALAAKLAVQPKNIVVLDRTVPGVVSPPGTMSLGCATPCTSGTLEADQPFYDVFLSCFDGAYTARTGVAHPVTIASGSTQNVIFGGTGGGPGTSDASWYVHDSATHYIDPSGASACLFDPPDTSAEPASTGIEAEWTQNPVAGVTLTLREEIVAFGDTPDNSGVRLSLGATNSAGSVRAVTMGVRWQIDYQNSWDDGPLFSGVHCQPFEIFGERAFEHEFTDAEIDDIDFYRIQNNDGDPIFGNFTSTTEIAGIAGTGKPDRLTYAYWPSAVNEVWNYATSEGACCPDSDSAVLYWYGFEAADGITIAPGESFMRSVIIFSAGDGQDCGERRPGECETEARLEICPGECAAVGATAVDGCGPTVVELVGTSPGAPPCAGNPCILEFPDEGTFVYTWRATDEAGNSVECTSTVVVTDGAACNQPPTCAAGGPGTSECRQAPIEGASVDDIDGDAIAYTWTSDNASVRVEPAAGVIAAGFGPRALPATVAILDDSVDPCGVSATLTLTVDDGRGGVSTCTTTVLFLDDVPPVVTSGPAGGGGGVICLWPPNHWYVPVAVADLGVVVSDSCTATTWTVIGCVSDQPDDAPDRAATDEWNGDGRTENDCVLSDDGQTIYVRSERCGSGPTAQDGRHYGIAVVATDACGNVSAPTVVGAVYVPHDQNPAETDCLNPTEIGTKDLP